MIDDYCVKSHIVHLCETKKKEIQLTTVGNTNRHNITAITKFKIALKVQYESDSDRSRRHGWWDGTKIIGL